MAVALEEVWGRVKNVCKQNGLLILSVLAVVIGCLLGFFLRGKQLSEQVSRMHSPLFIVTPNTPVRSLRTYPLAISGFENHCLWKPCTLVGFHSCK